VTGVYLTIVMAMTSVSVIMTVFVLNLHYRGPDDRPVPGWLRRILGTRTLRRGLSIKSRPTGLCADHANCSDQQQRSRNYVLSRNLPGSPPDGVRRRRSRSVGDYCSQSMTDLCQQHVCQRDIQFDDMDCREMSLHMTVETLASELSAELRQVSKYC
jgi:Neurotransmitter-gated ion-channel transmembrane region